MSLLFLLTSLVIQAVAKSDLSALENISLYSLIMFTSEDCFFSSDNTDAVDSALSGGGLVTSVTAMFNMFSTNPSISPI